MVTKVTRIRAKNVNQAYDIFRDSYPESPINFEKTVVLQKATANRLGFYQIEFVVLNLLR